MITFNDYAKKWSEEVLPLKKPATVNTLKSHIKTMSASMLGEYPINRQGSVAQRYFTLQSPKQAPKTTRNVYSTWHLIMASAVREDLISKIPSLVLPKSNRPEQRWLTLAEMRSILSVAGPSLPLYALLAETGLRIGEALALRVQDVHLADKTLNVRHSLYGGELQEPKTAAARRILSLSEKLCGILAPVIENQPPETFVFRSITNGHPLWPDKLARQFKQTLFDLYLDMAGWHAWRRGAASLWAGKLEIPLKVIAYRLGHEARGISLNRYAQGYVGIDLGWPEKIAKELFS